jgi:hypothetical protein
MSRGHGMNISTWLDGLFTYPVRVRGGDTLYEYPGACTCKVQYFAMYQMYSGGERSLGDSDRCYLRREVCTRARTTLQLDLSLSINGNALKIEGQDRASEVMKRGAEPPS